MYIHTHTQYTIYISSSADGGGTSTCTSSRPGRNSAESSAEGSEAAASNTIKRSN